MSNTRKIKTLDDETDLTTFKVTFRDQTYTVIDLQYIDWEDAVDLAATLNGEDGLRAVPKAIQRLLGDDWARFKSQKYDFKSFGAFASILGEKLGDVMGTPGESDDSET